MGRKEQTETFAKTSLFKLINKIIMEDSQNEVKEMNLQICKWITSTKSSLIIDSLIYYSVVENIFKQISQNQFTDNSIDFSLDIVSNILACGIIKSITNNYETVNPYIKLLGNSVKDILDKLVEHRNEYISEKAEQIIYEFFDQNFLPSYNIE